MPARLIDGKPSHSQIKEEVRRGAEDLRKSRGISPGLAFILVGDEPRLRGLRPLQRESLRGDGVQLRDRAAPRDVRRTRPPRPDRPVQRRPAHPRHPCAAPPAAPYQRAAGHRGDRSAEGRRRLPPGERGKARPRTAVPPPLYPRGDPGAPGAERQRPRRKTRGRRRQEQYRRQAGLQHPDAEGSRARTPW